MSAPVIARVYRPNGVNVSYRTTPGHSVQFRGGYAEIKEEKHMPALLKIADAEIEVEREAWDLIPGWINSLPEYDPARAKVVVNGLQVYPPLPESEDVDIESAVSAQSARVPRIEEPAETLAFVPLGPPNPENQTHTVVELDELDLSGLEDDIVTKTVQSEPFEIGGWAEPEINNPHRDTHAFEFDQFADPPKKRGRPRKNWNPE